MATSPMEAAMRALLTSSLHIKSLTCHHHHRACSKKSGKLPNFQNHLLTRRSAATATAFLASQAFLGSGRAFSFELRFTAPDQTVEEANAGIRGHLQDLLQIKELIESQSWRAAQLALRESSAYVKQDLYTIIQAKPGSQRPPLRKLYSNLFNSVSRLDYAARSKDASVVKECYDNIVATIDEIFSKI